MTSPITMLDAALHYAGCGLPVFPLWPVLQFKPGCFTCGCGKSIRCGTNSGKHPLAPLVPNGLKHATIDQTVIRDWWTTWPNANIGIATGGKLIVIDVDPRHGGDVALAKLEEKHGKFPSTWRVRTGGDGLHLYFAGPPNVVFKNTAGQLGDGLDVRTSGAYVVAPPSKHISGGKYEWQQQGGKDLAPMPAWLVTSLQQPKVKVRAPATHWHELARNGVAEGKRDATATSLAGHLLRRYVDPHVVLELMQAWNVVRCTPPLGADQITKIVNSIAGKELARRQSS
jgi:hypothetical protein